MTPRLRTLARLTAIAVVALVVGGTAPAVAAPARAAALTYQRISGSGSSWAANAIDAMRVNVKQFGITVDYNANGSTAGRKDFLNGVVDFAASDIPFQYHPEDGSDPESPAAGSYAYMPVTAGGTAFMYNLKINGKRVTNLRLSGENVSKIFAGMITNWNDPAIQADNPGLVMPARPIVPVVRSDGSGSTAQLTRWMIARHGDIWNQYCQTSGRAPACGFTSFYPTISGMVAQNGDVGVAGYVAQSFAEGAIGYVNYSYALNAQFPVVKLLNAAGYYTEPTPQNVAVSLLKAQINMDSSNPEVYLTQNLDAVYANNDARNYELSSYSYLILPTTVAGQFNEDKGNTLGAFSYYAMCQAQQQSESLGYSPMPINLVQASFDQIKKIPGVVVQDIDITQCHNPTFSADGTNLLADTAAMPRACDQQGGTTQCPNGTGGLANVPTPVSGGGTGAVTSTTVAAGGGTATTVAGGSGATATTAPASGDGATATTAASGGATATTVAGGTGTGTGSGSGSGTKTGTGSKTGTGTKAGTGTTASTVPGAATATTLAGVGTGSASEAPVPEGGEVLIPVDAGGEGGSTGDGSATTSDGTPACASDPAGCPQADAPAAAGQQSQQVAPALPTTLPSSGGWGSSVAMVLVVIFLTMLLVMAPAVVWRHYTTVRSEA